MPPPPGPGAFCEGRQHFLTFEDADEARKKLERRTRLDFRVQRCCGLGWRVRKYHGTQSYRSTLPRA